MTHLIIIINNNNKDKAALNENPWLVREISNIILQPFHVQTSASDVSWTISTQHNNIIILTDMDKNSVFPP